MAERVTGPGIECGRAQLCVVILMLVLSIAWLVVYTTVLNAQTAPLRISPETAAQLAREHAQEMRQIEAHLLQVYGGAMPPVAGS